MEWNGLVWGDAEQKRAKQNGIERRQHFHLIERKDVKRDQAWRRRDGGKY